MKLKEYILDKKLLLSLNVFAILSEEILLLPFDISLYARLYIAFIHLAIVAIYFCVDYITRKSYYEKIIKDLDRLEEKYLISELAKNADFTEGKILKEILNETSKSMLENVNKYKYIMQEYKEYIELWVHEVKNPIASSKMIIENNKTEVTKSIDEELDKLENYVDEVLYYARSTYAEKDYLIKKFVLEDVIKECIIKNKAGLIQNKISVNIHDLDKEIFSDSKWIKYMVNQIIQNSIKYVKPSSINSVNDVNSVSGNTINNKNNINISNRNENKNSLEIYSIESKEKVILYVKDTGIGIDKKDITRVWDKGFTGQNGRDANKKSTGIGLYLCKKLCNKLGLEIEIESIKGTGTTLNIIFPKSSYTLLK